QDGQPWFVAADICRCIGISNSRDATAALDDDEKGVALTDTLGGPQEVSIVSESGLYALILRSRKAVTPGTVQHRFRKWITSEVIPAIRKTGGYGAPSEGSVERDMRRMSDFIRTQKKLIQAQEDLVEFTRSKLAFDTIRSLVQTTALSDSEIAAAVGSHPGYVAYVRSTTGQTEPVEAALQP
ncbi:Bro-N domain-containing protein, partial [Magnetospirillum fulvum]